MGLNLSYPTWVRRNVVSTLARWASDWLRHGDCPWNSMYLKDGCDLCISYTEYRCNLLQLPAVFFHIAIEHPHL